MKEFKLLRYFKKWWWLVVACSVAGGIAFSLYALNGQTYVAQTVLAYTNVEAAQGKTPSGADIDPKQVMSSWVISQALENAGVSASVDRVRSRLSISEEIPDDVAAVRKAAWAEGMEYEYHPTEYVISYNSGADSSPDEARAILEAVVDGYYNYYGQHYVGTQMIPASLYALTSIDYDAIELVEALDTYVDEILAYVTDNAAYSPNFRSARTGYSFDNLKSEYALFQQSVMPSLYAQVLGRRVTYDVEALRMKYANRIAVNAREEENLKTRATDIQEMIRSYVEKNQENMDYHWGQETEDGESAVRGSNYVVGQVYEFQNSNYDNEKTTYDKLLLEYVSNNDALESTRLDSDYCAYTLDAYTAGGGSDDADQEAALSVLGQALMYLSSLEDILSGSIEEYMEYRAAQNLAITSTVNVYSTMNVKLYLMLAVVLFFFVGCIGAIVLGRGQDFVEYALYVDHTAGLPNREKCDEVLERFSQKPVEPPFACVYLKIDNIAQLNMAHGYGGGTNAIAAMGRLMRLCAENFGFVGYNNGAQFMGIFENCTKERAEYFLLTLKSAVDGYNAEHVGAAIEYHAAGAGVEAGEVNTAREILRRCITKLGAPA